MPDLKSDFVGRVNRLALRPSERNSLTPVMEAIHNSVYAITERFGESAMKKGRIDVSVIRDLEQDDLPVIGFEIEDNGVGFTPENYNSFLTSDSRLKEAKGGKGVGRLAWLKVFEHVTVDSVFDDGGELYRRKFNFRLVTENQIDEDSVTDVVPKTERRTRISFRNFYPQFSGKCPTKPETIASRILSHFVPLFIGGNAPKVIIHDGDQVDLEGRFADSIVEQRTNPFTLDADGESHQLSVWSLRCNKSVRFAGSGYNHGFIAAHNRSVIDYSLDDQIGLKALDDEFLYFGCAYGDYLNDHVNAERTGFTLESDELDAVKRAIAREARDFLRPYVEEALTKKVATANELIIENPQFLYVKPEIKKFAEGLQPSLYGKEDIFLELSRNRYRRQRTFKHIEKTIEAAEAIDEPLRAKIKEYTDYISIEQKGALAEYVTKRKAVIDLFEKFLEYKDQEQENYNREDALHQLICPMQMDSGAVEIKDHNLWLLDDRLAFSQFFASDLPLSAFTNVGSLERPDLAFFFDACIAWREGENTDTVVLVEFKKPMRDNYTSSRDPVQQVLGYVERLRTEHSVPDRKGRAIRGINQGTAFHCYVVADITESLHKSIIGRFIPTPDGQGLFGYSTNPPAFVEVVPYGKILKDAKTRNTIFFKTLGLTTEGD